MKQKFKDRAETGRLLADRLSLYANRSNVTVLALPRGGVPVAYEIAKRIAAPLDVFIVRKLGTPWNEELAMGAIATGGVRVLNDEVINNFGISEEEIAIIEEREKKEFERQERAFRGDRPVPDLQNRIIILVDNGIATGTTIQAAVSALRKLSP